MLRLSFLILALFLTGCSTPTERKTITLDFPPVEYSPDPE